jgi:toxin ParE1/3/4
MMSGLPEDSSGQLPFVLDDRAAAELEEAVAWYEGQSPGLGLELLSAVEAVHALLRLHPDLGVLVRPRIRRALLRRFPYGVFYVSDSTRIRILAIVHSHRHPASWPRRA